MITETKTTRVDIRQGAAHMVLRTPLATMDNQAHVFEAQVYDGDAAADLSGAVCSAYFIRADGVTVMLDGTVSGSTASVTLGANCYAVPGRFELAVKLTQGDTVHTILRAEGSVTTSRTDAMTGAGTGTQSFDQLIQAVNGATAEISKRDRVWNLLDNSDFRNPVNQRGENTVRKNWEYFIDRWLLAAVDSTPVYFDISNQSKRIGFSTETGSDIYLIQRFPKGTLKQGKPYTYAYQGWGDVHVGVISDFEETDTFTQFAVQISNGDYIEWVALYEGAYTAETLPAYVPKGYAAELMECRRYYYEFDALVSYEGTSIGAPRRMFVTLPVPMIRMPGITYGVTGGNDPHEIAMQSNSTVDITSADQGFSHLRVKLSAEL